MAKKIDSPRLKGLAANALSKEEAPQKSRGLFSKKQVNSDPFAVNESSMQLNDAASTQVSPVQENAVGQGTQELAQEPPNRWSEPPLPPSLCRQNNTH